MEYVAYHSAELMGEPLDDGPPFGMLTRKPVAHLAGQYVWVIEGRGKKKQYFLKCRFVVDAIDEVDDDYFRFRFAGDEGISFDPEIPLSPHPWFKKLLKTVANFSIGVTTLKPEFLSRFVEISRLNKRQSLDEVSSEWEFVEGEIRRAIKTHRTRSSAARQACIDHFGTSCFVCKFDFAVVYGDDCAGFIEVHHRAPVSGSDGARIVRPADDLIPLCPNCHRALHMLDIAVEELQTIWRARQQRP